MSYTVEVFTDDKAIAEIDITPALAGIALVGAYSERAEEIRTGNALRISTKDSKEIFTNRIKWANKLEADLNIVLTDRKLSKSTKDASECHVYGLSRVHGLARCAIVNTNKPDAVVAEVVAHEMGHMLEVPKRVFDRNAHCPDPSCIMNGSIAMKTVESTDTSNIYTFARNLLGFPVTKTTQEYDPQTSFCDDCSAKLQEQVAKISIGY